MLGLTGAGVVIGIRLVSEWFPAREVGIAEGIYGGWGNFGAAVAKIGMPVLAVSVFGGVFGWRYAIGSTGIIALLYSVVFYRGVTDTPKGATYFKPRKAGGLEVSTRGGLAFYLLMNIPIYLVLLVLAWRLSPAGLHIISSAAAGACYAIVLALAASGLFGQSFAFVGYLPVEAAARAQRIRVLEQASRKAHQTQIVIETLYRNPALWQALVEQLQPQTLLSVSCGLTLESGWTRTGTVAGWRQQALALPDNIPAVFAWLSA
jgi:sugar phosphate permease